MNIELINYFLEQNWMIVIGFLLALTMTVFSFKKGAMDTLLPEVAVQAINDGAIVVDVREAMNFEVSHIKNAINVPLSQIKQNPEKVAQSLIKNDQILMYCSHGSQTPVAFKSLKNFIPKTKLTALKGGLEEWKQSNFPVSRKLKTKKNKR